MILIRFFVRVLIRSYGTVLIITVSIIIVARLPAGISRHHH